MRAMISIVVALAACGKTHALGDAGMDDAQRFDGGAARVTVHVTSLAGDGAAVAGARVQAARADGSIVGETAADADGRAAIDAPSGGMVIVSEPGEQGVDRTVVTGVRDGDALEIVVHARRDDRGRGRTAGARGRLPDRERRDARRR